MVSASMLRAVMAGNPAAALDALPITNGHPAGNRAPVGFSPPPQALARRAGIKLRVMQRACHVLALARTANVRHTCSWTGMNTQGQKALDFLGFYKRSWTTVDSVISLSRRKHGFESRRARQ